jgi:Cu(I)/Ag(I) efflux system membrane fusion protein
VIPAALRRGPVALVVGLFVGALVLAVVPTGWLFRPAPAPEGAGAEAGVRYACPMFCTMASAPGTCPVCGMDMEPVTDEGKQVALGARERFMAGARTASVERRQAVHRIRALGKIRYDERREGQVTAWVSGRLDRLFVDFTGVEVAEGEKIAEIYAPELVTAQEELLSARRTRDEARRSENARAEELARNAEAVYQAARRRLLLLGMAAEIVDAIEESGAARDHLDIFANVGGTVIDKRVDTGDYVRTGDVLFDVVDLSTVWAMLEVFEEDAGAVFLGQRVEIQVPSLPGEVYAGAISFVDPVLDEQRRVVRVRVALDNRDRRLKPGSFVDAEILVDLTAGGGVVDPATGAQPGPVLLVPRSAVLEGGDRKLVYVMKQPHGPTENGVERWPAIYEPREVRLGLRVGDDQVVLAGLSEAEEVVTRGQFLIDSQLQLTGRPSLMIPEAAAAAPSDPHAGHGR